MTDEELELSRAAAILGRKGGRSRSEAKKAAVRENGKLGGRPMGSKDKKPRKRKAGETIVTTLLMVLLLASCDLGIAKEDWGYTYDYGFTPLSIDQLQWWIYENIDYMSDKDQYGEIEYWASPEQTMISMAGDCDDRAILFGFIAYKEWGYEPTFTIMHNPGNGSNHMVVSFKEYPGEYFLGGGDIYSLEVSYEINYGRAIWISTNTHDPNE